MGNGIKLVGNTGRVSPKILRCCHVQQYFFKAQSIFFSSIHFDEEKGTNLIKNKCVEDITTGQCSCPPPPTKILHKSLHATVTENK